MSAVLNGQEVEVKAISARRCVHPRFFALTAHPCPAAGGAFFAAFAPIALVYGVGLLLLARLDRRSAGKPTQSGHHTRTR
ncbi:MAG: hypothetical protein U0694_20360 [Anaerolineae bacterium]